MNNFDDYIFVYKNSTGQWNTCTNPEFIAEHKNCKALHKFRDKKEIAKLLEE